jgi:hypothetical protein
MAGKCYFCETGHPTIAVVATGAALGTCGSCSVLACSAHAARDPNYPRWVCVICDTSLLAASAVGISPKATTGLTIGHLVSSAILRGRGLYRSVDDFLAARPDMIWVRDQIRGVLGEAPRRFTTNATEPFWFGLTEEGRALLAAAIVIILKYEIREDELMELLRVLMKDWRSDRSE